MLNRKLRPFIYGLCYYLGILSFFYRINRKKQRILVFHHIIPDEYMNNSFEQAIVCTSRSRFDWMMSIVNKRFEVTTELGRSGSVIITFDDGYRAALIADEVLAKRTNNAYFLCLSQMSVLPCLCGLIGLWRGSLTCPKESI